MDTYEPAEDSRLLARKALEWLEINSRPGMRILDMGTGSGYIIHEIVLFLKKKGIEADIWASDIDKVEVAEGITFIQSDLFSGIKKTFDLIVFNPPYLPEGDDDRFLSVDDKRQLIGGPRGSELATKFISALPNHLKESGVAMIVASSRGHPEDIGKTAKASGLSARCIAAEHFMFEDLFVFLVSKAIRNHGKAPRGS